MARCILRMGAQGAVSGCDNPGPSLVWAVLLFSPGCRPKGVCTGAEDISGTTEWGTGGPKGVAIFGKRKGMECLDAGIRAALMSLTVSDGGAMGDHVMLKGGCEIRGKPGVMII